MGGCICLLCLYSLTFLNEHNAIWKSMQVSVYRCRVSIILVYLYRFGSDRVQKFFGPKKDFKGFVWILPPIPLFISQCWHICTPPPPLSRDLNIRVIKHHGEGNWRKHTSYFFETWFRLFIILLITRLNLVNEHLQKQAGIIRDLS